MEGYPFSSYFLTLSSSCIGENISAEIEVEKNIKVNPLMPRRTLVSPFTEISILFQEGIIKKNSYERCAYESVDEKSLS